MWYKRKELILNAIAVLVWITLNILYLIALGKCPYSYDDPQQCIGFFRKMYPIWLFETIIAGILWTILMMCALKKCISRYWIIVLIVNFFALFFYQSGLEMKNHGGLNRFTLTLTILVISLVLGIMIGLTKLWRYSIIAFVTLFTVLFILFLLFYFLRVKGSCGDWKKGLGEHESINDDKHCKVPIPTY